MKTELNTELISQISNTYIVLFLKTLNSSKEHVFLNVLLGFVYASKKILNSMQVLGILTMEQIDEIDKQLSLAAVKDVPKDPIIELIKGQMEGQHE